MWLKAPRFHELGFVLGCHFMQECLDPRKLLLHCIESQLHDADADCGTQQADERLQDRT
jgi:hypothetical protein